MLFNTPTFAVFLVIVLALYFSLRHRAQNLMLLVASYIFYGWWDWRFLSLIFISTVVDFCCARGIARARDTGGGKGLLILSVAFNLGMLGFFKYFDFFAGSLYDLLATFGLSTDRWYLNIILPVGISFYTFQTMSYTIDVYRRKMEPTDNFLDFALFVSFFPQLVAGPIERCAHLLPKISAPRSVSGRDWSRGMWLIFWGLFKKVVVADNLARIVNPAFADPASLDLASAALAVYAFAWQIYCDFSGYTDIARGCASCMGIDLCLNFDLPYWATNPSEFWNRWHISLSSWLRDYLYIPLGGNRGTTSATYRNLMLTMLLGGLWHGASWNFVAWGAFHGVLLIAFQRWKSPASAQPRRFNLRFVVSVVLFFHITCIGWLLFRIEHLSDLALFGSAALRIPSSLPAGYWRLGFALPVICMQVMQYSHSDLLVAFRLWWPIRAVMYFAMYWALISVGNWSSNEFLYFQF